MSKTPPGAEREAGARLWRGLAITALVLLVLSLIAGLLWFLADPLNLPPALLATLDQRASVFGMAAGVLLGTAGLVVALVALRVQLRAEHASAQTAPSTPPSVSTSGNGAVALADDDSGIVSTGEGARTVQMRAEASGQGRVYQAGGDQTINER